MGVYDGLAGNLYNVTFTTPAILIYAFMDQDCPATLLLTYPQLYMSGIKDECFSPRVFWSWWAEGILSSVACYCICQLGFGAGIYQPGGSDLDYDVQAYVMYTAAVLVVTTRAALAFNIWTKLHW